MGERGAHFFARRLQRVDAQVDGRACRHGLRLGHDILAKGSRHRRRQPFGKVARDPIGGAVERCRAVTLSLVLIERRGAVTLA